MKNETYDLLSKLLHWTMASIIIYASIAGYMMHLVVDNQPVFSFLSVLNMSLATVALPLFILRYVWRHFRQTPTMPSEVPELQKKVAKFVHSLIYQLMLVVFVSGFLMIKESYALFWLIEIDNPVKDSVVNDFFFMLHRYACLLLSLLILLHASAALKHHFINRNYVLKMMM